MQLPSPHWLGRRGVVIRRHVVKKWMRMRSARGDALAGLKYEHLLSSDAERELRRPTRVEPTDSKQRRPRTDSRSSPVLSSVGTMVTHSCTRGAADERCTQAAGADSSTFFCHCGNVSLKSGSCDTPGHVDSVGVPSVRKILNSWSISESPGNSGLWLIISTNMQPIDLFDRGSNAQACCAHYRQASLAARTICPQACYNA